MEESKERLSIHQMKVSISMVSSLKVPVGPDQIRDSKTLTLRSSTTNSQFFTYQPSLPPSQLVVLQVPDKPPDKRLSKLRRHFTNAQFTNTQ